MLRQINAPFLFVVGLTPDSEYDDLPPLGDNLYRIEGAVYRMESVDDEEEDEEEGDDEDEDNSGMQTLEPTSIKKMCPRLRAIAWA